MFTALPFKVLALGVCKHQDFHPVRKFHSLRQVSVRFHAFAADAVVADWAHQQRVPLG